ncbi:MAG TPA: hypothetical protein VNX68_10730 [Nitrosopumilaceae archaeon]|jgi:hypothetical protein|nr:hypothetical protein [Nitrosopumilaceae archaeon]
MSKYTDLKAEVEKEESEKPKRIFEGDCPYPTRYKDGDIAYNHNYRDSGYKEMTCQKCGYRKFLDES